LTMSKNQPVAISFEIISGRLNGFPFPEVDAIVGIAGGGTVPAALVAYKMQKPLELIFLNYRDEQNQPRHSRPVLLKQFNLCCRAQRILLVDDVSVSGQTLAAAAALLSGKEVKTFVLKGQADYVLFPELSDCVNWPWKAIQ